MRYAGPNAMSRTASAYPRLAALHDRIGTLPPVAAHLASARRMPFSDKGIFRHYPELDP